MDLKLLGGTENLEGIVQVPGDKSITHRALLLGSLASGRSRIQGALRAGVIDAMEGCLTALGVEVKHLKVDETTVDGGRLRSPEHTLDCQDSGTTMRLLLGALAGSRVSATLTGSPRLAQRPMARVVEPLRSMGADITGLNGSNQPPLTIVGSRLRGVELEMQVASAQVKTAVLLAGLRAEGATRLSEPAPSRDHTERMLRQLGVSISATNGNLMLEPIQTPLAAFEVSVPGDLSSAAFILAAALVIPDSKIVIERVGLNPTRSGLIEVLEEMGAQIDSIPEDSQNSEPLGSLTAGYSELAGIEVGADRVVSMIDEIPILAVIATQAHGETRVRGAEELRFKESDRLAAITRELRKMGARIEEHVDGIAIEGPTPLIGAHVSAHGDHRIAMALSIAGALGRGETTISNVEVIKQSFPGFLQTMQSVGVVLQ